MNWMSFDKRKKMIAIKIYDFQQSIIIHKFDDNREKTCNVFTNKLSFLIFAELRCLSFSIVNKSFFFYVFVDVLLCT
jgi:hypothetical protein